MKDNEICIIDDNGNEQIMQIYLTFEHDDKQYVVVKAQDDDESLYPFSYDENGNIFPVESDEEMELIEEVISAYEKEI